MGFLFGTNRDGCRYIGMNIVSSNSNSHLITVTVRENAGTSPSEFIIELIRDGGEADYLTLTALSIPDDRDAQWGFRFNKTFPNQGKYSLAIYYFPEEVNSKITDALSGLITSPRSDSMLSMKQCINSLDPIPECDLVYRGELISTSESVLYPYAPVRDEYEVIEKDATQYKTRK